MVALGRQLTASVQEEVSSLGASNFIVFPVRTDRGPRSARSNEAICARGRQSDRRDRK